jgi:antitoxin VapB
MSLNIKNPEVDRLVRELAARTGETLTEAVLNALRERLDRKARPAPVDLVERIMEISRRASRLPRRTGLTPDEIIGYDEHGVPR